MSDIEHNKQIVVEYYELAVNAKQPKQAVEKYLGPQYIQHNPRHPTAPFPETSANDHPMF